MKGASQSQPSQNLPFLLKDIAPLRVPQLDPACRSDVIHPSSASKTIDPRSFYLANQSLVPPPLVSCSEFVPRSLVEHLMRRKKDSALGVKFTGVENDSRSLGESRPDEITNMEGAMHTFVTPVIGSCEIIGDYRYDNSLGGHGVCSFDGVDGNEISGKAWLTRTVAISASIQMDFERSSVMLSVCKLDAAGVTGRDLGADPTWKVLNTAEKQSNQKRLEYDDSLRRHMVFHLTNERVLPARSTVKDAIDVPSAISLLEATVLGGGDIGTQMVGKYVKLHSNEVVSLELLFNTAVHQVINEFSALEALFPQGYVYTYDPASIFAREIGPQILNRLMLTALKYLSDRNQFKNLRIFAFNDYAEQAIMKLVSAALENQSSVRVVQKGDLFRGVGGKYDISGYSEAEGALLVVHNNSDGFGQNIETEGQYGSLDGAIGSNSSAAASLERKRNDLVDFIF